MAGPAPKTDKWTARENLHQPEGLHLIVGGIVEVSTSDTAPQLAAAPESGQVLLLDLTLADTGDPVAEFEGKPVAVWKAASYHTEVKADQYNRVQVRWDGKSIASFPVINDVEHGALSEKQAAVQNKVVGKAADKPKPKPKPGKKSSASKAVARVVKAVGDMAEDARKTLKKVFTKAPEKAAKKAKKAVKKAAKQAAKQAAKKAKKAPKVAKAAAKKAAKGGKKAAKKASKAVKKVVNKLAKKAKKKARGR